MTDLGAGIFGSALAFVLSFLLVSATCPRGWWVEGVRPDGRSVCRPSPPQGCGEPVGNGPECAADDRTRPVEVHCTGGAHPIVVNERTIGCQR